MTVASDAAEEGDEQGVEDADERRAGVGAVVGVGDQVWLMS